MQAEILPPLDPADTPYWDLSCPDWEARIQRGQSLIPTLPLDQVAAQKAVRSFNNFRIPDIEGKPLLANVAGDWFREIVAALFGSYDRTLGIRLIREIFLLVGKKNAKTTLGAIGIMLNALLLNKRPRAELLFVGPSKITAQLAFDQAVGSIEADEEGYLQRRFHITLHEKKIRDRRTDAVLLIKAFDSGVLTGVKPAAAMVDELHEIALQRDADNVIRQIRGGIEPNPEGFLMFTTTQSPDQPVGAFKDELVKARKIRDGQLQGVRMLPILYEFPRHLTVLPPNVSPDTPFPCEDPKLWPMVLPNLGKSITLPGLVTLFNGELSKGRPQAIRWMSQHLNFQIGTALLDQAWEGANYWGRGADPRLHGDAGLDYLLSVSEVVTIGLDGGGLDDLFSFCACGRHAVTKQKLLWIKSWMHPVALERRKDNAGYYATGFASGDLELVTEMGKDIEAAVDLIQRVHRTGLLPPVEGVGMDTVAVGQIVEEIVKPERELVPADPEGGPPKLLAGITQGWKLTGVIKSMARDLAATQPQILHGGGDFLNWVVGNARQEPRGNAVVITKQASGYAKIDPLIAALNADALMMQNPKTQRSVWDEIGQAATAAPPSDEPTTFDPAILRAGPSHPQWQKHRELFEATLSDDD